jgi:predicted transcriptional regulator
MMKIKDIVEALGCEVLAEGSDQEVLSGYTSDLLSDVMGNCPEGSLWITIQRHMNVIAVAQLKQIVAILLVNGARPEADVIKRAEEEGIAILSTKENAFQVSGKVFSLFPNSGN